MRAAQLIASIGSAFLARRARGPQRLAPGICSLGDPAARLLSGLPRRHLHIPLVQAERAWAYAMDLKSQLEQEQVGGWGRLPGTVDGGPETEPARMIAVGKAPHVCCRSCTREVSSEVKRVLLPPLCLQVAAKRQHLVRRLSKAASHAGELVALAAARCDARTQVQGAA